MTRSSKSGLWIRQSMFYRNSTSRILHMSAVQTYLCNRNKLSGRKRNNRVFIISSFPFKNFRYFITPLKKQLIIPLGKSRYSVIPPHKMALFQYSNNNSKNFCYSSSIIAPPPPPDNAAFFWMIKGTEESTLGFVGPVPKESTLSDSLSRQLNAWEF